MEQIDRPLTLTAAVAKRILEGIMRGDLRPGDPLREMELSRSLDISRGTVREALRQLQKDSGLVEILSHRGAFVAKLTTKRVREIYTLRALLEPYAVRLAMENNAFGERELEELATLVKRLGELDQESDYSASCEIDIRFHRLTSQGCQHQLLLDFLGNLQSQTHLFIMSTKLYRSDMVPDSVSHQAILDGIRSGDSVVAEQIVRQHITDAGSSLVKRMEEVDRVKRQALLEHNETPVS